jgi:hypothetical protein
MGVFERMDLGHFLYARSRLAAIWVTTPSITAIVCRFDIGRGHAVYLLVP